MGALEFPAKPVLLDGGLGRELRFRGVDVPGTIWSAAALMTDIVCAPAVFSPIDQGYPRRIINAECAGMCCDVFDLQVLITSNNEIARVIW